jgi:hypothetical protein
MKPDFKTIKWILKKQIEINSNAKWAHLVKLNYDKEEKHEFNCVHQIIPKEADHLYTAQQLLEKLTNDS